eukprot:TRINITY_DN3317_c0_g2_i3.p1 TRINITY_DN3317_c0_g2~~TRINITY_DN3317_c0_g2_i3.p1  ORF type:complete len:474 (-),score=71.64 TRINITY_DN3317_c0_g2_i3:234-1655(-)
MWNKLKNSRQVLGNKLTIRLVIILIRILSKMPCLKIRESLLLRTAPQIFQLNSKNYLKQNYACVLLQQKKNSNTPQMNPSEIQQNSSQLPMIKSIEFKYVHSFNSVKANNCNNANINNNSSPRGTSSQPGKNSNSNSNIASNPNINIPISQGQSTKTTPQKNQKINKKPFLHIDTEDLEKKQKSNANSKSEVRNSTPIQKERSEGSVLQQSNYKSMSKVSNFQSYCNLSGFKRDQRSENEAFNSNQKVSDSSVENKNIDTLKQQEMDIINALQEIDRNLQVKRQTRQSESKKLCDQQLQKDSGNGEELNNDFKSPCFNGQDNFISSKKSTLYSNSKSKDEVNYRCRMQSVSPRKPKFINYKDLCEDLQKELIQKTYGGLNFRKKLHKQINQGQTDKKSNYSTRSASSVELISQINKSDNPEEKIQLLGQLKNMKNINLNKIDLCQVIKVCTNLQYLRQDETCTLSHPNSPHQQ